jgi:hypothetical protein
VQQVKFNKYPSFVGMNIKATIDLASMVLVMMGNASQSKATTMLINSNYGKECQ